MRRPILLVCLILAAIPGCFQAQMASLDGAKPEDHAGWPKDWSKRLGKTVTVEGIPANAQMGALLMKQNDSIWIDGLNSWPSDVYTVSGTSKHLQVTGIVIQRDDVPAFVVKPGGVIQAGIPVENEKDLAKAKRRYLLKDATWTVLE